jgi:hypothetical protein
MDTRTGISNGGLIAVVQQLPNNAPQLNFTARFNGDQQYGTTENKQNKDNRYDTKQGTSTFLGQAALVKPESRSFQVLEDRGDISH